jgi:hypothetical protein
VVDPWCEHYKIAEDGPFGIDPVFLPSSSLYNANLSALDFYKPDEISHASGLPYGFYNSQPRGASVSLASWKSELDWSRKGKIISRSAGSKRVGFD